MTLTLLYEDPHLIVCLKPPGVPSQPDPSGSEDMTALLCAQLRLGTPDALGIVHRLDRPVGGIMVYTKTKKALAGLNNQLQGAGFNKRYLAVCCGTPEKEEGELVHWLLRDGRTNTSRIVPPKTPNAKEARLSYQVLKQTDTEEYGALCLVSVELHTGRHHQIRVQLAGDGLPIWGDTKYAPLFQKRRGWFQIGLFSNFLEFKHPVSGQLLTFTAQPEPNHEPFSLFDGIGLNHRL